MESGSRRATDWTARIRFPAVQDFYLFHSVQTDSGAHATSNLMGTGGGGLFRVTCLTFAKKVAHIAVLLLVDAGLFIFSRIFISVLTIRVLCPQEHAALSRLLQPLSAGLDACCFRRNILPHCHPGMHQAVASHRDCPGPITGQVT
jgi:hypothetical protein